MADWSHVNVKCRQLSASSMVTLCIARKWTQSSSVVWLRNSTGSQLGIVFIDRASALNQRWYCPALARRLISLYWPERCMEKFPVLLLFLFFFSQMRGAILWNPRTCQGYGYLSGPGVSPFGRTQAICLAHSIHTDGWMVFMMRELMFPK
jgi:hypothetical protein